MDTSEFLEKAYDSDAFTTSQTTAGYINPETWDKQLMTYTKEKLVLANLGKSIDMRGGDNGDKRYITIGVEPTKAAAVDESADVAVQAYEKTQVSFEPSERGTAYQMTNKEKDRTFVPLMQDMVSQLGYALAKKVDSELVTLLQGSAGNSVVADGVDESALASSNTIDYSDIVSAKKEILKDNLMPKYLVVNYSQYTDLLDLEAFRDVSQFGDRVAKTGFIGMVSGMEVFVTNQIGITDNVAKAIILAEDDQGMPAFGMAIKRDAYIETEYHALGRYTDVVAVMDYDVGVLRANGICTIASYAS